MMKFQQEFENKCEKKNYRKWQRNNSKKSEKNLILSIFFKRTKNTVNWNILRNSRFFLEKNELN